MATSTATVVAVKPVPSPHQKVKLVTKDAPTPALVPLKPAAVVPPPKPIQAGQTPPVIPPVAKGASTSAGNVMKNYRVTMGNLVAFVFASSPDHAWASFAAYYGIVGTDTEAEIYEV